MSEIERATDRMLYDVMEGIYVSDGGRSFRTDYHVHRKILFWNEKRCFSLSLQPNYQTISSRTMLTLRFKNEAFLYQIYVISEEENLNSKSFGYDGYIAFQKRIVKRLKRRGCVNYTEKYGNCTGREYCLERCIARNFIERYNRTTFGYDYNRDNYRYPVIDRDWFSTSEWAISRLMDIPKDKKIPEKACNEIKFERTAYIKQIIICLTVREFFHHGESKELRLL